MNSDGSLTFLIQIIDEHFERYRNEMKLIRSNHIIMKFVMDHHDALEKMLETHDFRIDADIKVNHLSEWDKNTNGFYYCARLAFTSDDSNTGMSFFMMNHKLQQTIHLYSGEPTSPYLSEQYFKKYVQLGFEYNIDHQWASKMISKPEDIYWP